MLSSGHCKAQERSTRALHHTCPAPACKPIQLSGSFWKLAGAFSWIQGKLLCQGCGTGPGSNSDAGSRLLLGTKSTSLVLPGPVWFVLCSQFKPTSMAPVDFCGKTGSAVSCVFYLLLLVLFLRLPSVMSRKRGAKGTNVSPLPARHHMNRSEPSQFAS